MAIGGRVVMEHALGGMQDVRFFKAATLQHGEHIFKVGICGFIASDIFGGVDGSVVRHPHPMTRIRPSQLFRK